MSDCEGQVCILGEKPAGPGENGMTETCGSFTLLLSPKTPNQLECAGRFGRALSVQLWEKGGPSLMSK